ncbi:VQ motif-containing protein 22-like [Benincasa hispida]|uniref:VQ motif-containing protein 22-like n=1 Tax=Benincasa hispida TaxID=102211 RepID=UPI0019000757|nr:VQ motif-containing protein 22-like [Benincasa hispida]
MSITSDQWASQFYHHPHGGASPSSATTHHGPNTNTNSISKPRRRSRASRKAPTTLLNASTANFRDLVQQFTGFQAAGAALPLGSHKGPVNLSFGQAGDDHLHNNHSSVMLPFSDGQVFQLRQTSPEHRFPIPVQNNGFSRPAAELMEIQNLIDEDFNYDLQELGMEFSSSSGNGNYGGGYFQ